MKTSHARIPLYNARVTLVFTTDFPAAFKRFMLEPPRSTENYGAGAFAEAGQMFMFFDAKELTVGDIAHEVFHTVHHVFEYVEGDFSHEPYAYLCDWLTTWVYRQARRHKIKIAIGD